MLVDCDNLIVCIILIIFKPIPTYSFDKQILLFGILKDIGHLAASKIISVILRRAVIQIAQLVYEFIYLLHLVGGSVVAVFKGVGVSVNARSQAVE